MSQSPYRIIGTYTIYAIHAVDELGDDIVYVGRTRSKDLRRVLRYHTDGRKRITAGDFSGNVTTSKPTIHVLEIIENCSAALAYRHNLAWHRHLDENGYVTIASEKIDDAAYTMLPETVDIYRHISEIEIVPLLEQQYIPSVIQRSDSELEHESDKHKKRMLQLNLKIDEKEHEAFLELCRNNNMTQREVFCMLLANFTDSGSVQIIKDQSDTIKKQLEKIEKLRTLPRGMKADIRLKEALSFVKNAINRYIDLMCCDLSVEEPLLKCITWDSFIKLFPNRSMYAYPAKDGFIIMQMEAICYGKGRYSAVFLWGEDLETGQKKKVRYYPKKEYIGISLPKNQYLYQGMVLLVGCRISSDGAADLYTALPVTSNSGQLWSKTMEMPEKGKRSLDEIINSIQV